MSHVLVDTNVLIRLNDSKSPARKAVQREAKAGHVLVVVPQVLAEYWAVATRPAVNNGLGMSPTVAHSELTTFLRDFKLIDDSPACFTEWQALVLRYRVIGKQTHDARLVGAMIAHGIGAVLTFNGADFERYGEITVIGP